MKCTVCNTRRPRRHCPGLRGEICAPCCGTERENTIDCPADCEYLIEAQAHERAALPDPAQAPNADIRVPEEFLHANAPLVNFLWEALAHSVLGDSSIVDGDLREALDGLARTYRTLQSGLYYDSRPANLIAAGIYDRMRAAIDDYRKRRREEDGVTTVRDADVLGTLVFLQRLEWQWNNGRKRGRAFLRMIAREQAEHGGEHSYA